MCHIFTAVCFLWSFWLIGDKAACVSVFSPDEHFFEQCVSVTVLPSKQLIKLYKEPLEKTFGLVSMQPCECKPVCNSLYMQH